MLNIVLRKTTELQLTVNKLGTGNFPMPGSCQRILQRTDCSNCRTCIARALEVAHEGVRCALILLTSQWYACAARYIDMVMHCIDYQVQYLPLYK
jgi:hypothetical protein